MSADKRRRARTQGRYSEPKLDLRNRETNVSPSDGSTVGFGNSHNTIKAQHGSYAVQSRGNAQSGYSNRNNPVTGVNNTQQFTSRARQTEENAGSEHSQSFLLSGNIGLFDFQTRNWSAQKPSIDNTGIIGVDLYSSKTPEKTAEGCFGEMEDTANYYGRTKETEEQSGADSPDGTADDVLFGKNMYVYEPTKLEDIKERKVRRISEPGWHTLSTEPSGKSEIYFNQDFINKTDQKRYFDYLNKYIKWELKEVESYGTKYPQPRMVSWFGPFRYGYSGVVLEANMKFPEIVKEIQNKIEGLLKSQGRNITFNSVLLNKYRDGKDSVAWHSDNELSMGIHPLIASVSLGETRKFELKRKQLKPEEPSNESAEILLFLESGSLVIMDGVMQQDWLHRVPKEFHDKETRINLTFRRIYPIEKKNIFRRS